MKYCLHPGKIWIIGSRFHKFVAIVYSKGGFFFGTGNIVGAIPCGVYTRYNQDVPCWPSDNWHNPKEIWVHSTSDWLWLMNNYSN